MKYTSATISCLGVTKNVVFNPGNFSGHNRDFLRMMSNKGI